MRADRVTPTGGSVREGRAEPQVGVAEELFRRQVTAAMRVAAPVNVANALNIVVMAVYVAGPSHRTFGLFWMALALLATTSRAAAWWHGERPSHCRGRDLSRRYWRVTAVEVAVQGVLNGVLIGYLMPRVDPGRQALLVATLAGVLGAGAVALSTLRSMGVAWVTIHALGGIPAFLHQRDTTYSLLSGMVVVYAAVLIAGVTFLADSFERRSLAEINALRAHQFVELLLDDFEGGARDWLWETDRDGVLTRASERLAEVSGYPVEELQQISLVELLRRVTHPSAQARASLETMASAMARGAAVRDHLLHVEVHGSERWWSITASPRVSVDGVVVGWRGVGADSTQAHTDALAILRLAETDPLTTLANRRVFRDRLESALAGDPADGQVHLAIFDLDNFKEVNDTLGHSVGDDLLVQVAARLGAHDGAHFVARLGGDEFAVVAGPTDRVDLAELLLFAPYQGVFAEPFTVRGNRLRVTASVGCAHTAPRSASVDELVGMADLALYAAKAAGVGRMSAFTASMSQRARTRAAVLSELQLAVERDEFLFHYQPQHELRTGRMVAAEALLRWQHPRRGLLLPAEFLEVAEESGLLVPIGEVMLRRACHALSTLRGDLRLAVNVSQAELQAGDFVGRLEDAIAEFGVEPRRLELEITETAASTAVSVAILHEVRELGVRIAVDDFGTGYSSLARLQRLPVDLIKVDRAFAADLRSPSPRANDVARSIMQSAVEIATALGIEVLAEGIEHAAQLRAARRLGFDLVQGFFVATPSPDPARHLTLAGSTDGQGEKGASAE